MSPLNILGLTAISAATSGDGAIALEGTADEWTTYLTVRGTLEPARTVPYGA